MGNIIKQDQTRKKGDVCILLVKIVFEEKLEDGILLIDRTMKTPEGPLKSYCVGIVPSDDSKEILKEVLKKGGFVIREILKRAYKDHTVITIANKNDLEWGEYEHLFQNELYYEQKIDPKVVEFSSLVTGTSEAPIG